MSKYNSIKTYLSPKCNKNKLESLYEICNNKENNHFYKVDKEKDKRLSFTLSILGLNNMINLFNEKNITFIDLLLLSKESMKELELEMYQRNRIYNFSHAFTKFAKKYTIDEIIKFSKPSIDKVKDNLSSFSLFPFIKVFLLLFLLKLFSFSDNILLLIGDKFTFLKSLLDIFFLIKLFETLL